MLRTSRVSGPVIPAGCKSSLPNETLSNSGYWLVSFSETKHPAHTQTYCVSSRRYFGRTWFIVPGPFWVGGSKTIGVNFAVNLSRRHICPKAGRFQHLLCTDKSYFSSSRCVTFTLPPLIYCVQVLSFVRRVAACPLPTVTNSSSR